MGNTIRIKPKEDLTFLISKRMKLLKKQQSMGENPSLKEWFKVSNEIRKVTKEIMEIKNARKHY